MNQVTIFFETEGLGGRIRIFDASSATVELAAQAVGCPAAQIAKTISLTAEDGCILLVAAGDAKIDNGKFKSFFGRKAVMLAREQVPLLTGHPVGGVCPFLCKAGTTVWLDSSLKRFQLVYTACGDANSVIGLSLPELERFSGYTDWVDVCKNWQTAEAESGS